jgi:hypothetical protein
MNKVDLGINRRIPVRWQYAQIAEWRDALGPKEPLYIAVCNEPCMDAPEWVAGGAHMWNGHYAVNREPWNG